MITKYINTWSYISWWLFWLLIQAVIVHRCEFAWNIAFVDSFVSNLLLFAAAIVTQYTYRFYQGTQANKLYQFAWSIVVASSITYLTHLALFNIFQTNTLYVSFLSQADIFRFVYALLMIVFVTAVSWLVFYIDHEEENNARKIEADNMLKKAELSLLQLQLQPHFLFNSLNSISALAGSQPEQARRMIQQLSDFYRATLKQENEQFSPFEKELTHLEIYLEIEKVRFGHRLTTLLTVGEEARGIPIPSLILQPVMENAIKFGLYDVIGEVEISLHARIVDHFLQIEITNPYDANTVRSSSGKGFGLHSIERRLALLYSMNNLLKVEKHTDQFKTIIEIPIQKSVSV